MDWLTKLRPQYELGSRWSCRSCTSVLRFDHLYRVAPAHPAASYCGRDGAGLPAGRSTYSTWHGSDIVAPPRTLGKLVAQIGRGDIGAVLFQEPCNPKPPGAAAFGAGRPHHLQLGGRLAKGIGTVGHGHNQLSLRSATSRQRVASTMCARSPVSAASGSRRRNDPNTAAPGANVSSNR